MHVSVDSIFPFSFSPLYTHFVFFCDSAALLEKIAELVNDKKLEGIADLRDETDREGMRMVIELKKDAVPAVVQNNLFKKTALQTSFPGNMLALVEDGTQPRRITLREALKVFIAFRYKFWYCLFCAVTQLLLTL